MARFIELCCRSESSRSRPNDRHFFASSSFWWLRNDPTFFKTFFNNGTFNCADGNRRLVNTKHTRPFTRCRTRCTCEFRKIIHFMFTLQCFFPLSLIHEVIPLWYQVIYWTTCCHTINFSTGLTSRDTTIHTTCTLLSNFCFRHRRRVVFPIC